MSKATELPCTAVRAMLQRVHESLGLLLVRGDQAHVITEVRNNLAQMSKLLEELAAAESRNVQQALNTHEKTSNGTAPNAPI